MGYDLFRLVSYHTIIITTCNRDYLCAVDLSFALLGMMVLPRGGP